MQPSSLGIGASDELMTSSLSNVGKQGERLPDVRPVNLQEKMKGCMDQILQGEPLGHSRDMGSTCKHVVDLVSNVL